MTNMSTATETKLTRLAGLADELGFRHDKPSPMTDRFRRVVEHVVVEEIVVTRFHGIARITVDHNDRRVSLVSVVRNLETDVRIQRMTIEMGI